MGYDIIIIEAGDGYIEEIDRLDAVETLEEAKAAAREAGYRVIDIGDGGQCETNDTWDQSGETYHLVTVLPQDD